MRGDFAKTRPTPSASSGTACEAANSGHKFRRQATIGPYIVDFLCIEAALVVEADGGQHSPDRDAVRTAWLESRGLRVARFWNNDILQNIDGVLQSILLLLEKEGKPSPNPLP